MRRNDFRCFVTANSCRGSKLNTRPLAPLGGLDAHPPRLKAKANSMKSAGRRMRFYAHFMVNQWLLFSFGARLGAIGPQRFGGGGKYDEKNPKACLRPHLSRKLSCPYVLSGERR